MAMTTINNLTINGIMQKVLHSGLGVPLIVLIMLGLIIVPLPPFILDVLFTFNITLSVIILLACVYVDRPLDFSSFPTVILFATLLRLALNIASTRLVLLDGHLGPGAAGNVIESFGEFVIGGNYVVGLVVFAILVLINFAVVTKGAGRISEVSARFTLDAMPGKQMAIDADLNAGLLDQDEAQKRRTEIVNEADFYGSMDGASKFVKGDAVAGILILFINIIGGFFIGVMQHGLSFSDAAEFYTLLTIGDGLVAQIPSLLLSTASAIIVTRVSSSQELGRQIISQLFSNSRTLATVAGIMGCIGIIPGMPNFAFLSFAIVCGGLAYYLSKKTATEQTSSLDQTQLSNEVPPPPKELGWDDVLEVDLIGLEVGYKLIPLVDKSQGGQLMQRIKGVRKKLSQDLGFLIPPVHIRDNLELNPNVYRITLHGVTVGESEIYTDRDMAINPGQVFGSLEGIPGREPAFGLEAIWIDMNDRDHAQTLGYTVVDTSTVVATHLSQLVQDHAHELLGREDAQQLLDKLARSAPKLVEELVPDNLNVGLVLKVLQNLLEEKICIRDMRTIAETLADTAPRSKDPTILTAMVRVALSRSIVQQIMGAESELTAITLDPTLEQLIQQASQVSGENATGIEPGLADRILTSLADAVQQLEISGKPAVLLVSAHLRHLVAKFARRTLPNLHVLSFNEIPGNKQIRVISSIGAQG